MTAAIKQALATSSREQPGRGCLNLYPTLLTSVSVRPARCLCQAGGYASFFSTPAGVEGNYVDRPAYNREIVTAHGLCSILIQTPNSTQSSLPFGYLMRFLHNCTISAYIAAQPVHRSPAPT